MEYRFGNVNTMNICEFDEVLKDLELACKRIAQGVLNEDEIISYVEDAVKHAQTYEEMPGQFSWGFDNLYNMPGDSRVGYFYNPTYYNVIFMISAYMRVPARLEAIDGFHEVFAGGLTVSANRGFMGHSDSRISDFQKNMKLFLDADTDLFVEKYPDFSPRFTEQFAAATSYIRDLSEMYSLIQSEKMDNYRSLNEYSYRFGENINWQRCWVSSEFDEGIRDIIVRLNQKGYYTTSCCEGHPEKHPDVKEVYVQIVFEKKYDWAVNPPFIENEKGIRCKPYKNALHWVTRRSKILAKKESDKQEILKAISDWVDMLPVREEN